GRRAWRRRRRQRDLRRARRPDEAAAAGRPWRDSQFLGRQGREQGDRARRPRQRARRRPDRFTGIPKRHVPRRPAHRPQPISAEGDRPSDTGRPPSDRGRGLRPALSLFVQGERTTTMSMGGLLWIIIVGFIAGIIARFLSPGPNNPSGFILTTLLGIVGAFLATFLGQAIGHYGPEQGAGFITATIGAIVVLFIWNRLVASGVLPNR